MADDPDMDADVWFDTIEGLEGEIEDKADGYAKVIAQLNADAVAIKAEEDRLYSRRKTIENRINNMKSRLQAMMELTGKTKFKTPLFSFIVQNNPASVVIDNESEIPAAYWIPQEPKLDKAKLKEDLKAGKTFEGIAHLAQTQSLRIR
jgi:hypothetical protein